MEYALITGAGSGIGRALAVEFAAHGYGLCLTAAHPEPLAQVKQTLEDQYKVPVRAVPLDLARLGGAEELFRQVEDLPISILVNNAGFGLVGPAEAMDPAREEQMLVLNVISLTELTRLFLPLLAVRKGKLLNVASTGAFQPGPYTASYFASKAYVLSYTRAVRREAPGVAVSVLCPSSTRTRFFERAGVKTPAVAMTAETVARAAFRGLMGGQEMIFPSWSSRLMQLAPVRLKMWAVGQVKRRSFEAKGKQGPNHGPCR